MAFPNFKFVLLFALFTSLLIRVLILIPVSYWGSDELLYLDAASEIWSGNFQSVYLSEPIYAYLISPAFSSTEYYFEYLKIINLLIFSLGLLIFYFGLRSRLDSTSSLLGIVLVFIMGQFSILGHAMTQPLLFLVVAAIWSCSAIMLFVTSLRAKRFSALIFGAVASIGFFSSPKLVPLLFFAFFMLSIAAVRYKEQAFLGKQFQILGLLTLTFLACFVLIYTLLPRATTSVYSHIGARFLPLAIGNMIDQPKRFFDLIVGSFSVSWLLMIVPMTIAAIVIIRSLREKSVDWIFALLTLGMPFISLSVSLVFQFGYPAADIKSTLFYRYYFFSSVPLVFFLVYGFRLTFSQRERTILSTIIVLVLIAGYYSQMSGLSSINMFGGIENSQIWADTYPKLYVLLIVIVFFCAALFYKGKSMIGLSILCMAMIFNGVVSSVQMGREIQLKLDDCALLKRMIVDTSYPVVVVAKERYFAEHLAVAPPLSKHRMWGDAVGKVYSELMARSPLANIGDVVGKQYGEFLESYAPVSMRTSFLDPTKPFHLLLKGVSKSPIVNSNKVEMIAHVKDCLMLSFKPLD
ncbi:ArnT family glycosyltransferase [Candidatus Thiosymbion oneisti]|uniref:ArnT family glycosyltransferase n=1 Tax=Candidatus Thiosymbion oneisti TaxID=589554 RepID=UPI00105F5C15|nr:hypothetical protein [Candidatus Thiosymbion oneisti]